MKERHLSQKMANSSRYPRSVELVPWKAAIVPVIARLMREELSQVLGFEHPPVDLTQIKFYAASIRKVVENGNRKTRRMHGIRCEYNGQSHVFDITQDFFRRRRKKSKKLSLPEEKKE